MSGKGFGKRKAKLTDLDIHVKRFICRQMLYFDAFAKSFRIKPPEMRQEDFPEQIVHLVSLQVGKMTDTEVDNLLNIVQTMHDDSKNNLPGGIWQVKIPRESFKGKESL